MVKAEVKEAIFRTMLRVYSSVNAGICPAFKKKEDRLEIPDFLWEEFGLEEEPPEDGEPGVVRFEYGYSKPRQCRDLRFGLDGVYATLRFAEKGWHPTFVPWSSVVEFFSLDDPPCALIMSVEEGQMLVPPRTPLDPDPGPSSKRPSHLKLVK